MHRPLRELFNAHYSDALYARMAALMDERLQTPRFEFRLAETPLFLGPELRDRCAAAANEILACIEAPRVIEACQEAIPERYRDLLLFEEPRSYQMGRNNLTHAEDTGGVSVVLAQHYEGWSGDPREARANPAK